ncbi:MAG: tetratricopeptide repeat protein, partial [Planctomycetota bacterium]|nr:tetratricopeptide repeat protein [Planctomycetota bacterium]
ARLHAEARTLRRSQGDLDGESRSLTNLANIAIKRADFRTARRHYAESLRLKREVGSLQAQAVSLSNLALVCNQLGEYGDALAQLEESLALRARAGDVIGEAITRRQCAALYLHKGELGRAGEELAQARDLLAAANAGDAYALPFAFQEAELLLQLGDARAAVARTSRTIDSLPASMRATERFDLLLLRARAHLLAGDHERARTDMHAARAGFEEQGDTLNVAWCRLEQGRLAMRLGHPGRARTHLDQARATAKALEARRLQCEAALALAILDGERDPDRAARELAGGSRLAEALGVPDLVIAAHALKGWQSLRLGQRQRALGWWRRCADAMNDALLRLRAQDDPARYLSHPERRRILRALDALVCAEEERRGLTEEVLR